MKKILGIVGVTFISALSLASIREVQYFLYGILGLLFLFSIGAGFLGVRYLHSWVRIKEEEVGIKEEEKLIKRAERKRKDVEAEIYVVSAKEDDQVYIRDSNHTSKWRNPTLDRRTYANGQPSEASEQDVAAWWARNFRRNPAQIPAMASEDNYQEDLIVHPLPEKVELSELLPSMIGSLENIVLGVRIDEEGQRETVSAPMIKLSHVGVAGTTDSGKSNFGKAIAYQIATAPEDCKMVISDLKGTTFKTFSNSSKLLYPIIENVSEFLTIMQEVKGELNRRKELFKPYPVIETLVDYNKVAEPLPFIVIFIDEISNLFLFKETQELSLQMLREARAFGMYFFGMGQSWSHREMDTAIRQQFRTGLHFGTRDKFSSRMMVNVPDAAKITVQGRAIAALPFGMSGDAIEIQTPYLHSQTIYDKFSTKRSFEPLIDFDAGPSSWAPSDKEFKIFSMYNEGKSLREICRVILDKENDEIGGRQVNEIKTILDRFGCVTI